MLFVKIEHTMYLENGRIEKDGTMVASKMVQRTLEKFHE